MSERQRDYVEAVLRGEADPQIWWRVPSSDGLTRYSVLDGTRRPDAFGAFGDDKLQLPDSCGEIDGVDVSEMSYGESPEALQTRFRAYEIVVSVFDDDTAVAPIFE
ncbi:hypothetical protein WT77_26280 [Burkholderia stagnalis]|uniref:hypothetical protein n=1 Tax=Burkholderia stagnalis TaxID=1503054 RepID=UPI00075FDD9D|nr:hypothetical protein [Burkholderia stagnalis]KWK18983.1 hypothetical protein WT77_26280 [Burkholderia stagnalis]